MGTSKRGVSSNIRIVPGPGQYNINSSIGSGPKFSMSLRTSNNRDGRNNISPGPANYSPEYGKLFKNTSYSMLSRPKTSKVENYPGVGNYDLRNDRSLIAPSAK